MEVGHGSSPLCLPTWETAVFCKMLEGQPQLQNGILSRRGMWENIYFKSNIHQQILIYEVQTCYSYMLIFSLLQWSSHGVKSWELITLHPHSGNRQIRMHWLLPLFSVLFSLKFQAMQCLYLHLKSKFSGQDCPNLRWKFSGQSI